VEVTTMVAKKLFCLPPKTKSGLPSTRPNFIKQKCALSFQCEAIFSNQTYDPYCGSNNNSGKNFFPAKNYFSAALYKAKFYQAKVRSFISM
jgi:hypothetical protein